MPGPENRSRPTATRAAVEIHEDPEMFRVIWSRVREDFQRFSDHFSNVVDVMDFMRSYNGAATFSEYRELVSTRQSDEKETDFHAFVETVANAKNQSPFITEKMNDRPIVDAHGKHWDYAARFNHQLWSIDAHVDASGGGAGETQGAFEDFRRYMHVNMQ